MTNLWSGVDKYLTATLVPADPSLEAALHSSITAGLPQHQVSPLQGKFLMLLAQAVRAENILEIGTLGGYSTIWLARALPHNGRLITLEIDPHYAEVAERNLVNAGVSSLVDIRVGPALDSLAALSEERRPPFDLVFLDADKPNNPSYLTWILKLSKPGTVIIADNVVRDGKIADAANPDPSVRGIRSFIDLLAHSTNISASAIQTVGEKGYDGFLLAVVGPEAPSTPPP